MSEFINNRDVKPDQSEKKDKLMSLIKKLHDGVDFNEVKKEFEKDFGSVSATEISELEQALINEGLEVTEVQRLCDVHSAVFKGSIEEIHGLTSNKSTPGHPMNTIIKENESIKRFISVKLQFHIDLFKENDIEDNREKLINDFKKLYEIDKHYLRKENLLFPYLEKYGIYGPAKVMWGVDDEIRSDIKQVISILSHETKELILDEIDNCLHKINEMIFKEESILLPMAEEKLTQDEWYKIYEESDELGYTFIDKPKTWIPEKVIKVPEEKNTLPDGLVQFETGLIELKQLEYMLNTLPVDITFIDEHDVVRYFSHGKERIFPRTKAVIGRTVQNCHPPQSVHVVNQLLEDFKNGKKDHEDFWINMRGMFILIRYFAVRDKDNQYLGTLEFTQNIKEIKNLEGEKRLLSE